MGAAARPQPDPRSQVRRPHAGGVDHRPRTQGDPGTGEGVHRGRLDPTATVPARAGTVAVGSGAEGTRRAAAAAEAVEAGHPQPGQDPGAESGGGPGQRDDETGVVNELAVPVQHPAAQPGFPERGSHPERLHGGQPAWAGQDRAGRARAAAQQVAEPHPGLDQRGVRPRYSRGQRGEHGQRPHEMGRGVPHQDVAFDGALPRQRHVSGGQVTQPAVNELGTPSARAEGEVVRLGEDDGQAAGGGVQGHPGPGDPTANHQQVHRAAGRDGGQLPFPPPGVQRGRRGRPERQNRHGDPPVLSLTGSGAR